MLNPERVAVIVRNSRRVLRARVGARKTFNLAVLIVASIAAGGLAVGFAKLCDWADGLHRQLAAALPWAPFVILPVSLRSRDLADPRHRACERRQRHPPGDRRRRAPGPSRRR